MEVVFFPSHQFPLPSSSVPAQIHSRRVAARVREYFDSRRGDRELLPPAENSRPASGAQPEEALHELSAQAFRSCRKNLVLRGAQLGSVAAVGGDEGGGRERGRWRKEYEHGRRKRELLVGILLGAGRLLGEESKKKRSAVL